MSPRVSAALRPTVVCLFVGWTAFSLVEPKVNATMRLYADYAGRAQQSSLRELYDGSWVEYPPLMVGLLLVTRHATDALTPLWSTLFPLAADDWTAPFAPFGRTFGLFGCVTQVLVFLGLFHLCWRIEPTESTTARAGRVGMYVLGSLLMTNLVHQRLDAMLAALILLSFGLLHHGRWVLSFLVLAAAINFKLVPLALAPLWVLASLPGGRLAAAGSVRGLLRLAPPVAGRGAVLVAFTAAWLLPFLVIGGPRCLAFLSYHQQRGIHTESVYGTVLLVLRLLGHPVDSAFQFGCMELNSPLSPTLGLVSSVLLGVGLMTVCGLTFVGLRRTAADAPAATADPGRVVAFAVVTLMTFAGLGKVFSPQFALWVIPLVPLLPLTGRERGWFFGLFLFACLLTRLASPAFAAEIRDGGPVILATIILVLRTVLWFGLTGWLAYRFARR